MGPLSASEIRALLASDDWGVVTNAIERFANDERIGVRTAVATASRRLQRADVEQRRLSDMALVERQLQRAGSIVVAGVDEVGRGALAGPVSAGACVLPSDATIHGLRDSKVLSAGARARLDEEIRRVAVAVAVAHVSSVMIDRHGITAATVMAMRQALAALPVAVDHVLVDGLDVPLEHAHTAIVDGDASVRSIAAAAIVAKVARDALMCELDVAHPGYELSGNKGYGSAGHLLALAERGPSPIHRMSFGPCAQARLF
jgi:ribonuclease HII